MKYLFLIISISISSKIYSQFYDISNKDSIEIIISKNKIIQNKIQIVNKKEFSIIGMHKLSVSFYPKKNLEKQVLKKVKKFIKDYEKGLTQEKLKYDDIYRDSVLISKQSLTLFDKRKILPKINVIKIELDKNENVYRDLDLYCIDVLNTQTCSNSIISLNSVKFYNLIKE
ncbi:hypothetical protein SAMN05443634_10312 [Chishuiella changwenlii]|uniref:Uncharacterized protein n=2 Tax=Chishuiella changwenlii TaxID=1434701 RepID=A0A1M6UQ74_9FLAO|nr:hypothetical protein [Chishuiella changwenlii]SHK71313.1 hypothetical protein SAMN05443634_10312 [Chishuiella changwenlii]